MFCEKCGKELNNESIVCPNCGCPTKNYFNNQSNKNVQVNYSNAPMQTIYSNRQIPVISKNEALELINKSINYSKIVFLNIIVAIISYFIMINTYDDLYPLIVIVNVIISIINLVFQILGIVGLNKAKKVKELSDFCNSALIKNIVSLAIPIVFCISLVIIACALAF